MAPVPPPHLPVLLAEVLAALRPRSGGFYVDCTVGAGGHAAALLEASAPDGRLLGLDADMDALALAEVRLRPYGARVHLEHSNFRDLATVMRRLASPPADGILLDLGVSSMQLDRPERGFSFRASGPLDMRMDASSGPSVADLINELTEAQLADVIFEYGEERYARRIARAIVARRRQMPFRSTDDVAAVVERAVPGGRAGGIHPATRTFQALRVAVNDELAVIRETLPQGVVALTPGGRLAVISFHSLEDRIVKQFMQAQTGRCTCPPGLPVCRCGAKATLRIVTKKPIVATAAEQRANPRSRSAKLRVAEKLGDREDS